MDVLDGGDEMKKRKEEEERLRLAKLEEDKKEAKEKIDEERGFIGKVFMRFNLLPLLIRQLSAIYWPTYTIGCSLTCDRLKIYSMAALSVRKKKMSP